jgi:hypothetical protein
MRRHSVDQFMYQTRIAMHITGRDTRKRIASMFMMIGVVIWSGASALGLSIGALIIINEILSFVVVKAMPKGQSDWQRSLIGLGRMLKGDKLNQSLVLQDMKRWQQRLRRLESLILKRFKSRWDQGLEISLLMLRTFQKALAIAS